MSIAAKDDSREPREQRPFQETMMPHVPGSSERPDLPLAVIVGAGGLGSAIARRFGLTHRLLIADINEERVMGFADALRGEGHDATGIVCDITDADHVAALAASATGWRTLAHVAALSPGMGDWRTVMTVNLIGTLNIEQAFWAMASPQSAAVFISSSAAHQPPPSSNVIALLDDGLTPDLIDRIEALTPGMPSFEAYCVSKFAMNRMCQRRATAWGQKQARLVSLSPGLIATPMGAAEYKNSPIKWQLFEQIPLQRECTMIEVAGVAAFLVSSEASYISGVDLLVDGGLLGARTFAKTES